MHRPLDLTADSPDYTAYLFWDELKQEVALFTKHFQLGRTSWLHKTIKKLLSKRNRILRDYKNTAIFSTLLHQLQEESMPRLRFSKLEDFGERRESGLQACLSAYAESKKIITKC
ncbi:hypothetical protein BD408DRAFT_428800 [Parasitella parasitica]|nr:hypothetical protein BD408DRAFT_428800 [Parasitella parasitica]